MTTAYLCIIMSMFIPFLSAAYAKFTTKGYDNKTPREFLSALEGRGKRANYAQQNFYETYPTFAVGVVVAHIMGAVQWTIDFVAVIYVTARILYVVFYVADNDVFRSIAWTIAFGAIVSLYFIGA